MPSFQVIFFPLFIGAAMVRDGDFVEAATFLGELDGDLRLEAEAIGFEVNAFDGLRAKDLVANLHVREVEVGKHIRNQSKSQIPHVMPEE
jgi:hypothetical protein